MSEWVSVLAVFWALWAFDGVRLLPRRVFSIVGGVRVRMTFSRLTRPGIWPGDWRMTTPDIPLSLSPIGVCNRVAGAAGRPVEQPAGVQAWRWEEIREVGVAAGWIFVNGVRFFPDTGHVTAAQLLGLARMAPNGREWRIRALLRLLFRPAHLRRRARVLERRTRLAAGLNAGVFIVLAVLTVYVVGDVASRIDPAASDGLADALPWVLLVLVAVHIGAVVTAWRAVRRLRAVGPQKRGSHLLSALLLPPQALRLRSLAGDGFFPAQHPVAAALAFGGAPASRQWAFQALADLRWPLENPDDPALTREITQWFRPALEAELISILSEAKLTAETLMAPPPPDAPGSCSYCPRCGDQFVAGPQVCPHGVALRPLLRG